MRVWVLTVLAACGTLANASYNLDGSEWSSSGLADVRFTSIVYSYEQLDVPFTGDCQGSEPLEEDGDPNTLGMRVDVSELTGGQINYVFHARGTLNPVTGAYQISHRETGLNIEFDVYIPDLGQTLTFVLRSIEHDAAGTVSGHSTCFINGSWRNPGEVMTSNPAATRATYRGYIKMPFNPTWTLRVTNVRSTGTKCECPGVSIAGRVNLQLYGGSIQGLPAQVTVRNDVLTESFLVPLDAGGNYSVETHIPGNSVEVLAKGRHWLRGKVTGVNTMLGNVSGVDFSLTNGDVDGDNAVTVADLNALLVAFGSSSSSADLEGSGVVGLEDLNILLISFGAVGEE